MKNLLVSLFYFLLVASITFFIWNILPDFGKLIAIILLAITGFFCIKNILATVFGVVFSHFTSLFTGFVALVLVLLGGLWGYNHFIKSEENIQATPFESESVIEKDPLTQALDTLNVSSSEVMISSSPSAVATDTPGLFQRVKNWFAEDTMQNDSAPLSTTVFAPSHAGESVTKEEIVALLEKNGQIGEEERAYWKEAVSALTDVQLLELKNILEQDTTVTIAADNNNVEIVSSSPVAQILNTQSPSLAPSQTSVIPNDPIPTESNWKKPVVIEDASPSNTPDPSFAPKNPKLVSSGPSDEVFIVPLQNQNAQMVFPKEYTVSSIVWTDSGVKFAVLTPSEARGFIETTLQISGDKYEKYAPLFVNTSPDENTFIISQKTEKSVTYTTFFAGIMWDITISLPFAETPTLDDFYTLLLPIIFEEKNDTK